MLDNYQLFCTQPIKGSDRIIFVLIKDDLVQSVFIAMGLPNWMRHNVVLRTEILTGSYVDELIELGFKPEEFIAKSPKDVSDLILRLRERGFKEIEMWDTIIKTAMQKMLANNSDKNKAQEAVETAPAQE